MGRVGRNQRTRKTARSKSDTEITKTEHFDDGKSLRAINHLEVSIYPPLFIYHRMRECLGNETR